MFIIKPITREEIEILLKNKIIFNTHRGMIDNKNNQVGYYTTKSKIYIEDKFVEAAKIF